MIADTSWLPGRAGGWTVTVRGSRRTYSVRPHRDGRYRITRFGPDGTQVVGYADSVDAARGVIHELHGFGVTKRA